MLSVLTVNIGVPSLDRARRQLSWLAARPEEVLVLTETRAGAGTALLAEAFTATGHAVTFPDHAPDDRGVMIVSKLPTTPDPLGAALDFLPARAAAVVIETAEGPLRIAGAYVPSRDATAAKVERKQRWIHRFQAALEATAGAAPLLLLGDLNVLEPQHQPRQPQMRFEHDFYTELTTRHGLVDLFRHLHPDRIEHSWARQPHSGFRYDHAHGSPQLAELLTACDYVHETRQIHGQEAALTDHSGLSVHLAVTGPRPLLTSDPTTAAEQDTAMTLF